MASTNALDRIQRVYASEKASKLCVERIIYLPYAEKQGLTYDIHMGRMCDKVIFDNLLYNKGILR